ncbi:MAG: cytochrome c3 family protein [Arenicellales bacterium]|nr:cytochrome c3 family protein [Arenicellales bacterium]
MLRCAESCVLRFNEDVNVTVFTLWTTLTTIGIAVVFGDELAPESRLLQEESEKTLEGCISCHKSSSKGFVSGHHFGEASCTLCHYGRPEEGTEQGAHVGLIAFPGNLPNARRTCGRCHLEHVEAVQSSRMATGVGIVTTTRELFAESPRIGQTATLSTLGSSPADSLLRKLCSGCHLNQEKNHHVLNPTNDRGGGCLACHINSYPEDAHPQLTARVSDARCFGCHSRSSRISLSYAGIGEVEHAALQSPDHSKLGQLDDGRLIEFLQPDVHHRAGMSCIDCHTSSGVMGIDQQEKDQNQSPDILCADCHRNTSARLDLDAWPKKLAGQVNRIPFNLHEGQKFLTTKRQGTPLWHIEIGSRENVLYRKQGGGSLPIPSWTRQNHPYQAEHQRLSCSACHSTWAPQCYGCHTAYDSKGNQWDHLAKEETAGVWTEQRWDIVNGPPPLGVTSDNRVVPVVPGMIMTLDHPDLEKTIFKRRFAPITPHTTGTARSCDSCHRSPVALGLGRGQLKRQNGLWTFIPALQQLEDGLPADGWASLNTKTTTQPPTAETRPFNSDEIYRILDAIPESSSREALH